MANVRRNPQGPLRYATLIQFKDVFFWDRTDPPPIAKNDGDSRYTVKINDRQDFVASRELQNSQLGWTIMERQDQAGEQMRLWPNDWYPGRHISIPSRDSLSARGIV